MKYLESTLDKDFDFEKYQRECKTDFHKILLVNSVPSTYQYLQDKCDDDDEDNLDTILEIQPKELLNELKTYCNENNMNCSENGQSLKLKLLKIDNSCYKRKNYKWYYVLEKTKVIDYLKRNKLYIEKTDEND